MCGAIAGGCNAVGGGGEKGGGNIVGDSEGAIAMALQATATS